MKTGVTFDISARRVALVTADKLGRARIGDIEYYETGCACGGIKEPTHGFNVQDSHSNPQPDLRTFPSSAVYDFDHAIEPGCEDEAIVGPDIGVYPSPWLLPQDRDVVRRPRLVSRSDPGEGPAG